MPDDSRSSTMSTRDPSTPAFWDERFDKRHTPWDRCAVPANFAEFVRSCSEPGRALIPGCGAAYEAGFLAESGWQVTAIDYSTAAVRAARAVLGRHADVVHQADFFAFQPPAPFSLIYERAFLCALPRPLWPEIARRWVQLLVPGGLLAGFFYHDDRPGGPPFGMEADGPGMLLAPYFTRLDRKPVEDSVDVFRGKESWQVWRRLPDVPAA